MKVELSAELERRAAFLSREVERQGYGLVPFIDPNQLRLVRDEMDYVTLTNTHLTPEDAPLLPDLTRAVVETMGQVAINNNATPKQIIIIKQEPGEVGIGHFDVRVQKTFALPLSGSELRLCRPGLSFKRGGQEDIPDYAMPDASGPVRDLFTHGVERFPELDEHTGEINFDTAHRVRVPVGWLVGFAGTKAGALGACHRVDNPSNVEPRFSIVLGCQ